MDAPGSTRQHYFNMLLRILPALLCGLTSVESSHFPGDGQVKEYCKTDIFNASCQPNEVIFIESAHYGRMRVGSCIGTNYQVGCSRNVLPYLASKCSGKNSCRIEVVDAYLINLQVCRTDLVAYLEAAYTCKPVHTSATCGDVIDVSEPGLGYIKRTSYNSDCHMRLTARPGQQINLTLYDFSLPSDSYQQNVCQRYIEIQEKGGHKEMVNCDRTMPPRSAVFVSQSHEIELKFLHRSDQSPVILKYETIGCANVVPSGEATVFREKNVAKVHCRDKTWHLVCNGKKWIGEFDNCTAGAQEQTAETTGGRPVPLGLIMAVAIGIVLGVFFGVAMLALVICCRRRRHRRNLNRNPQTCTDEALLRDPLYGPGTVMIGKGIPESGEKVYQPRVNCASGAPNMKGALQMSEAVLHNLEKDRMDFDYGHTALCARDMGRRRDHEYESPRLSHDVRAYETSSDNSIYRKCESDPRAFKVYTIQPGVDRPGSMKSQCKDSGYRPVPTDECFS